MDKLTNKLKEIVGDSCFTDEPMSKHTTFRCGGNAAVYVVPRNTEELAACIKACRASGIYHILIGNGSNLLVSDKGINGVVISTKVLDYIDIEDDVISAGCGASLGAIANAARDASLAGLEFAAGIPGSLGGGCVMNAGAYGGEMKDVLVSINVMDAEGEILVIPASEAQLSYRCSIFLKEDYIVTGAVMKLKHGSYDEIDAVMRDLAARRRDKQPLEYPSAGSTFKRPEGYFAGALIEEAGLKGKGIGGACVSEKHAGFVINRDNATSDDIYKTIMMVKDEVKMHSGVELECEIRMIGEF